MPRQTQQQRFLATALRHVEQVAPEERRIYGGLCHTFPIMVRTNGLCQALAFVHEKKGGDGGANNARKAAYARLWSHVAEIVGKTDDQVLPHLQSAPAADYLRDTRRVLDAWFYYKRFAVSILNVTAAEAGDDATAPETAAAAETAAEAAP